MKSNRIPIILSYNSTLPVIKKAINKDWDVLKINIDFGEVFTEPPMIDFRPNRNKHDSLAKKAVVNNKKTIKSKH